MVSGAWQTPIGILILVIFVAAIIGSVVTAAWSIKFIAAKLKRKNP